MTRSDRRRVLVSASRASAACGSDERLIGQRGLTCDPSVLKTNLTASIRETAQSEGIHMNRRFVFPLLAALSLALSPLGVHAAGVPATWDTDQQRTTPVPHRYIHGLIRSDVKFQVLLPTANWNGKIAIFTRGFSGTELSTGAFQNAALTKGYAFASCDEGWFRSTIAVTPQDDYYESRQSLVELTVYTKALVQTQYGQAASRTLLVGTSNGGHHTRWMVEAYPLMFDGGISGFGYNSQLTQWGSVSRVVRNYDVIVSRIDDIIAERAKNPQWNPFKEPLSPPLTKEQLTALKNIYDIPMELPTAPSRTTAAGSDRKRCGRPITTRSSATCAIPSRGGTRRTTRRPACAPTTPKSSSGIR